MAIKTTKTRPRPTKPRVCPDCLASRPDYNGRQKYPPPCHQCKSDKPPIRFTKSLKPPEPLTGDAVLVPEIVDKSHVVNLKDEFTPNELAFLEIYLSGEETIDNAMIKAGYGHLEKGIGTTPLIG